MNCTLDYKLTILGMTSMQNQLNPTIQNISNYISKILTELINSVELLYKSIEDFILKTSEVNNNLFGQLTDDQLELFCDANFWQAYRESKNEELESGTIEDLRKKVGL